MTPQDVMSYSAYMPGADLVSLMAAKIAIVSAITLIIWSVLAWYSKPPKFYSHYFEY